MNKYRIDTYIVDDHAMFNEGLTDAVNRSETVRISHSFTTLEQCRNALAERCPDVLLLDVSVADGDSLDFCKWVTAAYPKVRIVAVTIHDEYHVVRRMLEAGTHGYVLKSAPVSQLVEAIEQVWKGHPYVSPEVKAILSRGSAQGSARLTNTEQLILRLICQGLTNPAIASRLHLGTETINWYRKRLLAKLDVKNTAQLVTRALEEKIVYPPFES